MCRWNQRGPPSPCSASAARGRAQQQLDVATHGVQLEHLRRVSTSITIHGELHEKVGSESSWGLPSSTFRFTRVTLTRARGSTPVRACLLSVLREDGFLPTEAGQASDRTILVAAGRNWIGVYDELCDEQLMAALETAAQVEPFGCSLKVTIPSEAALERVERALAPLLPSQEDARLATDRLYGR